MRFSNRLHLEIECLVWHVKERYMLTEKAAQQLVADCLATELVRVEILDWIRRRQQREQEDGRR